MGLLVANDGGLEVATLEHGVLGTTTLVPSDSIPVSGYIAKAVHFDGSIQGGGPTYLSIASLTAPDSGVGSFAVWVKGLTTAGNAHATLFQGQLGDGTAVGIRPTPGASGDLGVAFTDAAGTAQLYTFPNIAAADIPAASWRLIIASAKTDMPPGQKTLVIYINDTKVDTSEYIPQDAAASFNIGTNGIAFYFADDSFGDGSSFDCADARVMPGISLLTGADISEATRRLFIDAGGKPVDPAVATAALGAPAVLFSGDATGFATNQGTGGAFTLTGTLTNASTSPSD